MADETLGRTAGNGESLLRQVAERLPVVIWLTDRQLRFTALLGADLAARDFRASELVGKELPEYFRSEDPASPLPDAHLRALQGEEVSLEHRWSGRTFRTRVGPLQDDQGQVVGCIGVAEPFPQWPTQETRPLCHRLVEIANRYTEKIPLLEELVAEIQGFTGCAAVGIRLLDNEGNIPYEAYTGFSRDFYESESPLSINRDRCMCINVVRGTTDANLPFFTTDGSFYTNGTTRLLATVAEQEKGPTRNRCHEAGYESVALVPIRSCDRIIGVIHVADARENMVPLETVRALEEAAVKLGSSIVRVWAEDALKKAHDKLDDWARQRTAELAESNRRLRKEIDERQTAERELRASEALYRSTLETISDAVFITDDRGRFTFVSPNADTIFGYSHDEIRKLGNIALLLGEDLFDPDELIRLTEISNIERDVTVRSGQTRSLLINVKRVCIKDGTLLYTCHDVTERKFVQEKLRRAERLASIGTLAAGIAHEINNPLGAIVLYAKIALLAEERPEIDETPESCLRHIQDQAFRCSRIVRSVLQFAKEEVSEKWPHDLGDVARRARDLTRALAAEKGAEVQLEIHEPLPEVAINPTEMTQVFVNLISNALEASASEGRVYVRIEPACESVRAVIEDRGRGMTAEELRHAFDPFYTTRQREGASGLGLSTAYGIVEQHGGTIHMANAAGPGTTTTITLPVAPPKPAAAVLQPSLCHENNPS